MIPSHVEITKADRAGGQAFRHCLSDAAIVEPIGGVRLLPQKRTGSRSLLIQSNYKSEQASSPSLKASLSVNGSVSRAYFCIFTDLSAVTSRCVNASSCFFSCQFVRVSHCWTPAVGNQRQNRRGLTTGPSEQNCAFLFAAYVVLLSTPVLKTAWVTLLPRWCDRILATTEQVCWTRELRSSSFRTARISLFRMMY